MRKEKFHSEVLSRLATLAHPYLRSFSEGGRGGLVITRRVSPLHSAAFSGQMKAFTFAPTTETLLRRQRGPFPSVCLQTGRPAPVPHKSSQFRCLLLPTSLHTHTEFKLSPLLLQLMLFVLHFLFFLLFYISQVDQSCFKRPNTREQLQGAATRRAAGGGKKAP